MMRQRHITNTPDLHMQVRSAGHVALYLGALGSLVAYADLKRNSLITSREQPQLGSGGGSSVRKYALERCFEPRAYHSRILRRRRALLQADAGKSRKRRILQ